MNVDTILLSSAASPTFELYSALVLRHNVSISADMPGGATLTAAPGIQMGLLEVRDGAHVVLQHVRIQGGRGEQFGGVLVDHGVLHAVSCTISDCESGGGGGGVLVNPLGTLLMQQSNVSDCRAPTSSGGGIFVAGSAQLQECRVEGCLSSTDGGGLCCRGATAVVTRCVFEYNKALFGGGVAFRHSVATLSECTIRANEAANEGGGVLVGAATATHLSNVTLIDTLIIYNNASVGSGMYAIGSFTIIRGEMRHNYGTCTQGLNGALYNVGVDMTAGYLLNTRVWDNKCHNGSSSPIYNGGTLYYVLPAPLGHFVDGTFFCETIMCAMDGGQDGGVRPCSKQPCNATRSAGQHVASLRLGSIETSSFPPLCKRGFVGDRSKWRTQDSKTCAGYCPVAHYCPHPGTVVPLKPPPGSHCQTLGHVLPTWCQEPKYGGQYCPGDGHVYPVGPGNMTVSVLTRSSQGQGEVEVNIGQVPCENGHYCLDGMKSACEKGTYMPLSTPISDRTSKLACKACPDSTTLYTGATSVDNCTLCLAGFYRNGSSCLSCPPGGSCDREGTNPTTLTLKPGYWRPSIEALPKECSHPQVCAGGDIADATYDAESNVTCAPGRGVRGAFCQLCIQPTYAFHRETQLCEPPSRSSTFLIVLVVVVLLAVGVGCVSQSPSCYIFFQRLFRPGRARLERTSVVVRQSHAFASEVQRKVKTAAMRSIVPAKICISFYQVVTQMGSVYRTVEPPPYHVLLKIINHLLDWIPDLKVVEAFLGLDNNLKSRLLAVTLVPPSAVVPVVLSLFVWKCVVRQLRVRRSPAPTPPGASDARHGHDPPSSEINTSRQEWRRLLSSSWFFVLGPSVWLAFLISVPISSSAFLAIRQCECFWLRDPATAALKGALCFSPADYTLKCPSTAGPTEFWQNATGLPESLTPDEAQLYDDTRAAAWLAISLCE